MSHHSQESFGDPRELERINSMIGLGSGHKLGATGQFPDGQLAPHDDREFVYGSGGDPGGGKVLIDFGKPIRSIGMTLQQASDFADLILEKVMAARGIK